MAVVDSPNAALPITFTRPGTYTVLGRIKDKDGSVTEYTTNVHVVNSPLAATGRAITAVGGQRFTGVVATFTDGNRLTTSAQYLVTVIWGDGTQSQATVSGGVGSFAVTGTHVYRVGGTYATTVLISKIGGPNIQTAGSARVTDAPISATGRTLTAGSGTTSGSVVASFVDANKLTRATDYRIFITWGDGTSSLGTVRMVRPGVFEVLGSHTYARAGTFRTYVSIVGAGGSITRVASLVISSSPGRRV